MWVSVAVTPATLLSRSATTAATSSWLRHPDQGDQVDLAGDGVDLADAVEGGDLLGHLGDPGHVGLHEHDGGDHAAEVSGPAGGPVARGRAARRTAPARRRDWSTASWRARWRVAPPTGQVHSPSTSTSRTPGDSSQRRTRSDSSAVAAGTGPGPDATVSAAARRPSTKRVGVGAGRDHAGRGQPAVADDVDRPAAVVLAAGGDDLGAAGQRGAAAGCGRRRGRTRRAGRGGRRPPRSAPRRRAAPSAALIASTTSSGRRSRLSRSRRTTAA